MIDDKNYTKWIKKKKNRTKKKRYNGGDGDDSATVRKFIACILRGNSYKSSYLSNRRG